MVWQLRFDEVKKEICSLETVWCGVVLEFSSQQASVSVEEVHEVQEQKGDVPVGEEGKRQNKEHPRCP